MMTILRYGQLLPTLPLVIARVFECLISLEHVAKRIERCLGHSLLSRLCFLQVPSAALVSAADEGFCPVFAEVSW